VNGCTPPRPMDTLVATRDEYCSYNVKRSNYSKYSSCSSIRAVNNSSNGSSSKGRGNRKTMSPAVVAPEVLTSMLTMVHPALILLTRIDSNISTVGNRKCMFGNEAIVGRDSSLELLHRLPSRHREMLRRSVRCGSRGNFASYIRFRGTHLYFSLCCFVFITG
jgi:hypothetical protein